MHNAPKSLYGDIYWSFAEPLPLNPAALVTAVSAYASDIEADDHSDDLLKELPVLDMRIAYTHSVRDRGGEWTDVESEVRIVKAPLTRLTGADILWELHAAFTSTVAESDHHFFEGLELADEGATHATPRYRVILGS